MRASIHCPDFAAVQDAKLNFYTPQAASLCACMRPTHARHHAIPARPAPAQARSAPTPRAAGLPPLLGAASPAAAPGARWSTFWELEDAGALAAPPQKGNELPPPPSPPPKDETRQEALNALKLGVQPILRVWMLWVVEGAD